MEVVSGDLGLAVAEVVSGADAFARLKEANQFTIERPDGEEYVLLRLRVRNTAETGTVDVDPTHFGLTASGNVLYPVVAAVPPEPWLMMTLDPGASAEGWVALRVGMGETRRQAVYLGSDSVNTEAWRFLALEEEAALPIGAPARSEPNALGASQEQPLAEGEVAITESFAVSLIEAMRGADATERLLAASDFNPGPAEGYEQVLVKVSVTSRLDQDNPVLVSGFDFAVADQSGEEFMPNVAKVPDPELFVFLYPGGVAEGWVAFDVEAETEDPLLVFSPLTGTAPDLRYFSIE
jgi:hypothetical protein